ncbi:hypothetical protein J4401_02225 [Candidatus Woesearchaeota archaeon]|nr:hypothetical protein [Candidatus Woesearchaeota archaeon]
MKHTVRITVILLAVFMASQVMGLLIIDRYIDHAALSDTGEVEFSELPYGIERPPVEERYSSVYIVSAVLIGTLLLLMIIKWRKVLLWKIWYFLSVFITLGVAFAAFLDSRIALALAAIFGYIKVFRPNVAIHNLTEIFVYGGLAAIFVPIMNPMSAIVLLFLISIYDIYAVWKSKHMIKLAEFTSESNVFAGISIPYGKKTLKIGKIAKNKGRNALLGGGDIGFPLLFTGVIMKEIMKSSPQFGFLTALIIPVFCCLSLAALFYFGEKNKFYPAMPFISAGCLAGYMVISFI